jgi:hypothetical protein
MANHLQFGTAFTWSHAIDNGTNTNTTGWSPSYGVLDPYNMAAEKGNSNNNVPLRFTFNAVGEAPWHVKNPVLAYLANDWQLSPVFAWQNGLSYSAGTSGNVTGGLSGAINGYGGVYRMYGTRNQFHMPNTQNLDMKLSKVIRYKERYSLELSGEMFNVLNHQNVTAINSTAYTVGTCSATSSCAGGYVGPTVTYNTGVFGSVTNANSNFAYSQRQIQVGVRVKF